MNDVEVLRVLKAVQEVLPEKPSITGIDPRTIKKLFDEGRKASERVAEFVEFLSPIKAPAFVFDPTDPNEAGELIATKLFKQPRYRLEAVDKIYGSGVYAIYFFGAFDAYRPISGTDSPIYVGKADPEDPYAATPKQQGAKLFGRLRDHLRSITAASSTLSPEDFECRFLVVKTGWESAAEDYLIKYFKPVWNNEMNVCYGFGKHGDSAKTRANTRSPWDTIHPGRTWATKEGNVPNPLGVSGVKKAIAGHYEKHPPIYPKKVRATRT